MSSIMNRALKYGVAGGVTFGALYYISGGAQTINVFGNNIALWGAGLGLGVASSLTNDFVHNFVLPALPIDDKLASAAGTGVSLASGAGTTLAFAYLAQPQLLSEVGVAKLALVGAGSEILSEYAYQKLAMMFGYSQAELVM